MKPSEDMPIFSRQYDRFKWSKPRMIAFVAWETMEKGDEAPSNRKRRDRRDRRRTFARARGGCPQHHGRPGARRRAVGAERDRAGAPAGGFRSHRGLPKIGRAQ